MRLIVMCLVGLRYFESRYCRNLLSRKHNWHPEAACVTEGPPIPGVLPARAGCRYREPTSHGQCDLAK